MGEAKEIIEGKAVPVGEVDEASVVYQLGEVLDELDTAMQIKLHDLHSEGDTLKAENHFKLGILRGADLLIRRAQAMLEDYGTELDIDTDPSWDETPESETTESAVALDPKTGQ